MTPHLRPLPISIPADAIAKFCVRNHIRKLSLFGSVLREDFDPSRSDVDMLVEFETGLGPGLLGMVRMERELSAMVGRKVDLRTAGDLSLYFVDRVVREAEPIYVGE